jgi:DtxR family Mn-dependent transcriptional regulator
MNAATKEYLEAIYELTEEGQRVLQARIGERLGLAPATVSQGMKRLAAEGMVLIEGRDIRLSDRGERVAQTLVRRHRLAERMLVDLLGIPWHLCHEQAEDWEKVMTPEVENAIIERIDGCDTCPHGNPIPGTATSIAWSDLEPVAALEPGRSATLVRLLEDVELNRDVLKYLEDAGLMPGAVLTVTQVAPDRTRTVRVQGRTIAVGADLAGHLWVLADSTRTSSPSASA